MKGQQVVIAGCGDLGAALACRLMAGGARVWGIRRRAGGLPAGVLPMPADLGDAGTLPALPEPLDVLVYCAAPDARSPEAYRRVYLTGLANVLDRIERQQLRPRRVVLCSSTAVYHQQDGSWVDEASATEPATFNGRILLAAEHLLADAGLPYVVARLGGIYGPGRTALVRAVRAGTLTVRDRPPEYTNRIHLADAAGALAHLVAHPDPERCYVLVDSQPAPRAEVADWLAAQLGVARPRRVAATQRSPRQGKRCRNARLLASGYRLTYPDFRAGYRALLRAGEI